MPMPELTNLRHALQVQAMVWSVSLTLMMADDAAMLAMLFS